MKCAGCLKPTKEANTIKCTSSGCNNNFCTLCINVSSFTNERRTSWKCSVCSALLKKDDNFPTPGRSGEDTQNITQRKKVQSLTSDSEKSESELKELTIELRQLMREFASLSTKLEEVTQSLTHCHGRMDELSAAVKSSDSRIKTLEKRDQEVIDLKATVSQLQADLNAQAQFALRNELEIVGIPESPNENLQHVVLVTAQKLGVELQDGDIDYITRVSARRPPTSASEIGIADRLPRPIVVRLLRRSKREQILKASKSRRNITSADLELAGGSMKLYFNERLTKENRELFRDARTRAKTNGYLFCWCTNGSIYIRQREGKAAMAIKSQAGLDSVLPARVA